MAQKKPHFLYYVLKQQNVTKYIFHPLILAIYLFI